MVNRGAGAFDVRKGIVWCRLTTALEGKSDSNAIASVAHGDDAETEQSVEALFRACKQVIRWKREESLASPRIEFTAFEEKMPVCFDQSGQGGVIWKIEIGRDLAWANQQGRRGRSDVQYGLSIEDKVACTAALMSVKQASHFQPDPLVAGTLQGTDDSGRGLCRGVHSS